MEWRERGRKRGEKMETGKKKEARRILIKEKEERNGGKKMREIRAKREVEKGIEKVKKVKRIQDRSVGRRKRNEEGGRKRKDEGSGK